MKHKLLSLTIILGLSLILSSCASSSSTTTKTEDSAISAAVINSTETEASLEKITIPDIDYSNVKLPDDPQSWIKSTSPKHEERDVDPGSSISITFKYDVESESLNEKNIMVNDGKHSRTITELYNFNYDKDTRTLHIDFKLPGNNVGTGNGITVYLSKNIKNAEGKAMGFDMAFGYSTK